MICACRSAQQDHSFWSAFHGTSKPLVDAQRRMEELPGAAEMLRGLTAFEPSRRISSQQAMESDLFEPFTADAEQQRKLDGLSYMSYLESCSSSKPDVSASTSGQPAVG